MLITTNSRILNDKDITWIDMHHHSKVSDGSKTPNFLYKWAKKNKKGICLTDHNRIKGSLFLAKQKDILTIPSIEVASKELKETLAYFYSAKDLKEFWQKEIKGKIKDNTIFNFNRTTIPFIKLLKKVKDYNGINILAHPVSLKPKTSYQVLRNKEVLELIDGVETFNFTLGNYNFAKKKLDKYNLPETAGSDSHSFTKFNTLTGSYESKREDFIESILKKKNIIFYKKGEEFRRFIERAYIIKNNLKVWTKTTIKELE